MQIIPVFHKQMIDEVERLARQIWPEYYTPLIGARQVAYMLERFQSREAVAAQIGDGVRYYLIEDEEGDLIGYFAMVFKESELFLSKFYLTAERRNQGYGRRSLEFMQMLARQKKLPAITLTVNKHNAGSLEAYRKLGFEKIGPIVQDIGGGFVMDDYILKLTLG